MRMSYVKIPTFCAHEATTYVSLDFSLRVRGIYCKLKKKEKRVERDGIHICIF